MIYIDNNNTVWFIISPQRAINLFQSKALPVNVLYEDGTSLELSSKSELDIALANKEVFGISLGDVKYIAKKIENHCGCFTVDYVDYTTIRVVSFGGTINIQPNANNSITISARK